MRAGPLLVGLATALIGLVAALPGGVAEAAPAVETAVRGPAEDAAEASGRDGEAALPELLSRQDAERYRTIFALQKEGRWAAADAEIERLGEPLLMGHVLGQRYLHPTAYRSKYSELRDWLAKFADHPEARRIHRLALKRKPRKARAPTRPVGNGYLNGLGTDLGLKPEAPYRSTKRRGKEEEAKARKIQARVRARVRRGWPTGALEVLEKPDARRLLDRVEYDRALALIAAGYFAYAKDEKALAAATAVAQRSAARVPTAHWTAGLALWRLDRLDEATGHFEALALSKTASAWDVAGAAYWAARAHLIARRPHRVSGWLAIASEHPRTFYGLLAYRALGREPRFDWSLPALDDDEVGWLMNAPGVRRALALIEAGQARRAETELRKAYGEAGPRLADGILALAIRGNLPGLAMRIGVKLAEEDGRYLDAAIYPIPGWEPDGGFRVDRALLFAVMRQESRFKATAKSPAGARGLMQIMPRTANFISDGERFHGKTRDRLFDPELNLTLGQKYLGHLLDHEMVRGNMFLLAAAYNGGMGKLARWQRRIDYRGDPLLFIESIPSRETRDFVERVLASFWIYRHELGQPTPSLNAVAGGEWPTYIALDGVTTTFADHGRN
ncbi:MAG: lytic transglycosylase domain-containing protein [Alphaproteobacteria bacterium]